MVSRCDYYSDEEYEYAVQMEIEEYREQLAYEEEYAKYCEDEYGSEVSPLDDDYDFYKREYEDLHNPLSDDYNKYENE